MKESRSGQPDAAAVVRARQAQGGRSLNPTEKNAARTSSLIDLHHNPSTPKAPATLSLLLARRASQSSLSQGSPG